MAKKIKVVKKKKKKGGMLYHLVVIFLLAVIVFSSYQLYGIVKNYLVARKFYSDLSGKIKFERTIDFAKLKKINPDVVGWIYSEGTVIDYPVVQGSDNDFYLSHMFNRKYHIAGSIFMDCSKNADFDNSNTVLYGHHMKDGSMFASLMGYKRQKYFEKHKTLMLYTPKKTYRAKAVYGFVIDAFEWDKRGFVGDSAVDSLIKYAEGHSTFTSKEKISSDDRILTLCTCSYEYDQGRYVLILKLEDK